MRLAILNAVLALATAQLVTQDPAKNFCRRHQQQTCVVDSRLYIDGGLAYYGTGITGASKPERNTYLLYGDLTQLGAGTPPLYSNLTKGSDVPTVSGGVLWPDQVNKLYYLFGGEFSNVTAQSFSGLWFYDILNNKWDRALSDGSQAQISWPAFGASAVTDEGMAYYYGGYLSNKSVSGWTGPPLMLNSLVKYDMTQRTWSNRTDGIARAEGALQYIAAGDRGMLIYFGGMETSSSGSLSYSNMSQVQVFDIANSRWYTQTATGDIPRSRRGFCSGVVWAKDKSSYNIYIFGGISSDGTAVGDVYILSLPSFTWIPYWDTPDKKWFGGKAWASCNVINKSQMIVMSGFYTNVTKDACDQKDIGGQATLLLGQESVELGGVWKKLDPKIVEYRVPSNITAVIGGDADGKASVTAPAAGWATADLSDGFKRTYSAVSRAATRPVPSSTTSPLPSSVPTTSSSSSTSTNVGAIAGGVVGGVVVLAAIFILLFCCLRARRRKRANTTVAPAIDPNTRSPTVEDKSVAHFSMSQGSTMYSPQPTSAYSPAGSPRPMSDAHSSAYYHESPPLPSHKYGERWEQPAELGFNPQQGQQGYQQTYYPPPQSAQAMRVELPVSQTPAQLAEMPNVKSPKPVRGLY